MSRHGAKPKVRCAVYTRKSSEEGLELTFNSLNAQREACAAYIDSQRHEGWLALDDRYDDGGYSGGTLERPALQRLIQDIEAGRVDTVVCYKIDRLSRSLTDFARLVDVFERNRVTFVSVTQSFCTTTSMGRLTLNIAAAAEQVNQRNALGVEQLEGEAHPLGRVFDAREGVCDISKQVLTAAQVAALITQRDAHLRQRILCLAGALRRLGRTPGEALQRHVEGLLLDAGRLRGKAQLLQRLHPDPDLVRGLAEGIGGRDRAIDQRAEPADRRGPDHRAT
jgi:Resolvase, N terminal domain